MARRSINFLVAILAILFVIIITSNTLLKMIVYSLIKTSAVILGILALYNYFVKHDKHNYYNFAKYMIITTLTADILIWDLFSMVADIAMVCVLYIGYKNGIGEGRD